MSSMAPLIVIVGPTASGKTSLGIEIAKKYNGEIICADSRTVYKGMDIGTAKPTAEEQAAVAHHLIDIVEPNESFTAADFKQLAGQKIDEIAARGKLPIMVGGTGLYIDSVIFDYNFGSPADEAYREQLNAMNIKDLQELCREKDIEVPFNRENKRHLVRAIELGGLPKRDHLRLRENTIVVGITTEKDILNQRIAARAVLMFESGVIEEARILGRKYGWQSEAMTGNIYPIIKKYLEGEYTRPQAIEAFIKSDIHLAKRQKTWFKRNPFIYWSEDKKQLITKVDQFVENLNT